MITRFLIPPLLLLLTPFPLRARESYERPKCTEGNPFVLDVINQSSPNSYIPAIEKTKTMDADAKRKLLPVLLTCFDDAREYELSGIGRAISKMGPRAVPVLKQALEGASDFKIRGIVYALGEIGPRAWPLVPDLTELVKSSDREISLNAIIALGKIGPGSKDAVPALLTKALVNRDGGIKNAAQTAITRVGLTATPLLLRAVNDPKYRKHHRTLYYMLGRHGTVAVPAILKGCEEYSGKMFEHNLYSSGFASVHKLRRYEKENKCARDILRIIYRTTKYSGYEGARDFLKRRGLKTDSLESFDASIDEIRDTYLKSSRQNTDRIDDAVLLYHSGEFLGMFGIKAVPNLIRRLSSPHQSLQFGAIRGLEIIYTPETTAAVQAFWKDHPEYGNPYEGLKE